MTAEFTPDHEAEARDQALWDEPTPIHLRTNKEVALLPDGAEVFDEIELGEVGDARGKTLLHLQCHIGTDSLASVRHGAVVTGVDVSAESIACAGKLKKELGLSARFIQANVYDALSVVEEPFDVVYTSKGVRCWMPGGGASPAS